MHRREIEMLDFRH